MPESIQNEVWRYVGFFSAVVGQVCFGLSSSFTLLFGEWNFLKICLYVIFSVIILCLPLLAKVWQRKVSILFQNHMAISVLFVTSVCLFFYDKAVDQKPDAYILISCAAFAVMSLCLSKQTEYGFEVDLLKFFLGLLIVLLMKINMWLFFVGAGFACFFFIILSWSDTTSQRDDVEPQDHLVLEMDSLIQQISDITHRIDSIRHQVPDKMHRTILNKHCELIKSKLRMESKEVQKVGILGMEGIGKTAIAKAVFHQLPAQLPAQFDCTCFLENIREDSDTHGLNYVSSKIISKLLGRHVDIDIDAPKVIPSDVTSILRNKKVLIVLDEVNSLEFAEKLIGLSHDWLGDGSIVILTSKYHHVLRSGGVDEDLIYEVKQMDIPDSLQLFSLYAFNQIHPATGYEELSNRMVFYSRGIPLALAILGSFLHSRTKSEWATTLSKLGRTPNQNTQEVWKMRINELGDAEREIFLDIACFFEGHDRGQVSRVLNACGFFADYWIRVLLEKGLMTIDSHNCIKMHGLIQEMGREVVRQESIENPERRSRLWNSQDVMDVLTSNRKTDVGSMFLDMTQIPKLHLSSYAFKKMPKLRLLAFDSGNRLMIDNPVSIPKDLELPVNLRYLQWNGYPLNSLPSIRCKNLVDLSMPHSNLLKLWDGKQDLRMLKKIYLAFSKRLKKCPDLSGSPNLESVSFCGCENLANLHPSIFNLQKLEELDVSECTSLKSLCSKTCSPSLQRLYAVGCTNLRECSITTPGDECKTHLYMKFER